MSLMEITFGMD